MENIINKLFVVKKQSGVNILGWCELGRGESRRLAMEDAFGPKPWSPWVKKQAKQAIVDVVEL